MKGKKQCPSCQSLVGCRSHKCGNCNHFFSSAVSQPKRPTRTVTNEELVKAVSQLSPPKSKIKQKKNDNQPKKRHKTVHYKECPKCYQLVKGARTRVCPNCRHIFVDDHEESEVNWRELMPGEYIKVKDGTGPYKVVGDQFYSLGYSGLFRVSYLSNEGIHAYGINEGGHCFIYMGKPKQSKANTEMIPHVIKRVDNTQLAEKRFQRKQTEKFSPKKRTKK